MKTRLEMPWNIKGLENNINSWFLTYLRMHSYRSNILGDELGIWGFLPFFVERSP